MTIVDTAETRVLEVANAEGVVLGIAEDDETGEVDFAVRVGELNTLMLRSDQVIPTGRSVPRETIYDGATLRVTRDGWPVASPDEL